MTSTIPIDTTAVHQHICQKCSRRHVIWISFIFPGIILLVILNVTFNRDLSSSYVLGKQTYHFIARYPLRHLSYDPKQGHSPVKRKLILGWHGMFVSEGNALFKRLHCDVQDCTITYDRNLLNQSDALVVRIPKGFTPPNRISSSQRWVFLSHESPLQERSRSVFENSDANSVFNWTMTYRTDSDILFPWGHDFFYRKVKIERDKENLLNVLKSKPKLVSWIVSHCETDSKRELYVKEMQKYIPVDIYGECGNLSTPEEGKKKDRATMQLINNTYLFFLAFENALCQEYITEKFFRILPYDVIPVVRGGLGYSGIVPEKWYINARDFSSPKQLAEYLLHLKENPEEMLQYFHNKHKYNFNMAYWGESSAFCTLCKKLNDPSEPIKIYEDMESWWSNNTCEPVTDIPGFFY